MSKQLLKLQEKIDKKEIDFSTLNTEQLDSLRQASDAGVINVVGGVDYQAAKQADMKNKIKDEAVEAGTMKGVKVPVLGQIFNERADYELTGDVIGSFTPYIMMRKKIAEDLAKGVGSDKFMAPEGKENFKLNKFASTSSKFYKAVSRVVGKRFGKVGRLLPRIAARAENTAIKTTQFARQMAPKSVGGGGGITDQGQSLLRTGAQTEMYSLGLGATGAAGGSVVYDLANFSTNIGSDALLDLNEISEADYKQLPPPARMLVDAGAAFANSAIFGVAGTTAGYYAVKGGRSMLKTLTGTNNPEAIALAKLAKEKGMDLSTAQLAQDSGFGSVVKNFFKILGVTPFIGGAGRKKTQTQLEKMLQQTLQEGEQLAPITFGELLGAEGIVQLRKNYNDFESVIKQQYSNVDKVIEQTGMQKVKIIPTNRIKSAFDSIITNVTGAEGTTFKEFFENVADNRTKKAISTVSPEILDAMQVFAGKNSNLEFNFTSFADYKNFKRTVNNLIKNPGMRAQGDQSTLAFLKVALDEDLIALEKLRPGDLAAKEITDSLDAAGKKTIEEAQEIIFKKEGGLKNLLQGANKTFFDLTSIFQKGVTNKIRKGVDPDFSFLTSAMVNKTQLPTTPLEQFKTIQSTVLHSDDAETIRQFKRMLGATDIAGEMGDKGIRDYADKFVKKLGSRKIFDAFYDSLDKVGKENVTTKSFMQAREVLKNNGIKSFKFADEGFSGIGDTIPPGAIEEIRNMGKKFIDGKPNPSFIESPAVRQQLQQAITVNTKNIDMSKLNLLDGDFDYSKFADNLGIGTPAKEDALKELVGQKGFENLRDTVEILKSASSLNFTNPSTFLARRAALVGIGSLAGGAVFMTGGLGLFGSVATAVIGRRVGSLLADPKASSKLLDIMTEQERKAAMDPETLGRFLAGPNQPSILGVVDPTKPLGDYYGPKRSRQLANFLNYFDSENKDQIRIDPEKVTLNDVNEYMEKLTPTLDTPEVNIFQLPDQVLESAFPEVLFFKYAPQDQRDKILETLKGLNAAEQQVDAEDAELEKIPDAQPQPNTTIESPTEVPDTPAEVPENTQSNMNQGRQSFSFLFPGDTTGQAIAQKDQD